MARQFTRGRGRLGSQRKTSWFPIDRATTALDNSSVLIASLTVGEQAKRPFTIIRTHLEILMVSDQVAAAEVQNGAVGMCVVSDQAAAVGVSAVPTPITDAGSDLWFLHQWTLNTFAFATAVGFDERGGRLWSIDSKAMRKVNDDEDVVLVGESEATGDGFIFTTAGRILIKEH